MIKIKYIKNKKLEFKSGQVAKLIETIRMGEK